MLRMLNPRQWSERTVIALVMQHLDNSITTFTKRDEAGLPADDQQAGPRRAEPDLDSGRQRGHPPDRQEDRRRRRRHLGRVVQHPADRALPRRRGDRRQPRSTASSTRISGCTAIRRCSVMDGAAISANLGVNPSLSITAQAERAASLWPNKGAGATSGPAQGEPYKRLAPIPPEHPVVPADAPAALRHLPIEPVSSVRRIGVATRAGAPARGPAAAAGEEATRGGPGRRPSTGRLCSARAPLRHAGSSDRHRARRAACR